MIPEKNKSHTRMGHIAFPTAAPGRGLKRTPCRAARGDVWSRREEPCKVCECFTEGGARVVVARPGRRFSWEDVFCSEGNCVSKKPMKLNRNVREKIHLKATLPSSRGRHTRGDGRRLRERREAAAGSGCVRRGEAGRASRRESAARRGSEAGREGRGRGEKGLAEKSVEGGKEKKTDATTHRPPWSRPPRTFELFTAQHTLQTKSGENRTCRKNSRASLGEARNDFRFHFHFFFYSHFFSTLIFFVKS
jgi:hypothetical protein